MTESVPEHFNLQLCKTGSKRKEAQRGLWTLARPSTPLSHR
jgi:hypothetical protein